MDEKLKLDNKKVKKEIVSKKMFWVALPLLIVLLFGIFFGKDLYSFVNSKIYLSSNDISEDVQKDYQSYLNKGHDKYLVYFYDSKICKDCSEYSLDIKDLEKETKLNVYKVNLNKVDKKIVEDDLFIDSKNGYLIVVEKGAEDYRYIGNYPIDSIEIK